MGFLSKKETHDQIVEPDELKVLNHMVLRIDQRLDVLQIVSRIVPLGIGTRSLQFDVTARING